MKILSPEGTVGTRGVVLAAPPAQLAGRRIAVLDNGKPGAALVMTRIAERLVERAGVEFVGLHRKRTAATPCEEGLLGEIADGADLVLTGLAD
ncbi:MAG: hypothetical protein AAF430_25045 [Myxococcota bacterium]